MTEPARALAPMLAVFAALLVLMYWGFDALLETRNNPNLSLANAPGAPSRVVLTRNRAGRYVAPGTLNGKSVTFLIDTGADDVAVPARIADRVGLERGPSVPVITAGGRATAYLTQIDSATLGGIRLRYIEGSINPAMTGDYVLLGMSFLRHVNFSQRGDELIIEPPTH